MKCKPNLNSILAREKKHQFISHLMIFMSFVIFSGFTALARLFWLNWRLVPDFSISEIGVASLVKVAGWSRPTFGLFKLTCPWRRYYSSVYPSISREEDAVFVFNWRWCGLLSEVFKWEDLADWLVWHSAAIMKSYMYNESWVY